MQQLPVHQYTGVRELLCYFSNHLTMPGSGRKKSVPDFMNTMNIVYMAPFRVITTNTVLNKI